MQSDINIGGYYGIHRELIFISPVTVIVRFYPFGNYDSDLEYKKRYNSREDAMKSIAAYSKETIPVGRDEAGPQNNDWGEFERKVNGSMIDLYKDAIAGTLILPDGGTGYNLNRKTIDDLIYWVNIFNDTGVVKFVEYRQLD